MAEIRSYEGSAADLREFVTGVWRTSYGGRMAFPLWTPAYFRWQLGVDSDLPRDQLIAAYDGDRLIGTILGFPSEFRTPLGPRRGSQGSWLSIDPEYRRQGIATQLRQELRRRHADLGLDFQLGFGYFGSRHSLGPSFWKSQREQGTTFLRQAGFWVRVLNARRAANWNLVGWERWLTRSFGWMAPTPRRKSSRLQFRPYRPEDSPACLKLLAASTERCGFARIWDESTLARHLEGGGVARTLLADRDSQTAGFVNWHCLPFLGRTEESIAVIDLIAADELSVIERYQMLSAALAEMKQEGAALALKLRTGDYPAETMLSTGFVPRLADSYIILTWAGDPEPLPVPSRLHLLWR